MRPTAGRWVSGDDFFDRERELRVLKSHVRDHNRLLLTSRTAKTNARPGRWKDWFAARFRDHHVALEDRYAGGR